MDIEKLKRPAFPGLEKHLKPLRSAAFAKASQQKKSDEVSKTLFTLIDEAEEGEFLLLAALDFLSKVAEEKIVEHYTLSTFEVWLNQFSGISFEENYRIRGKIMGKWIPREAYQEMFPVAMGKVYPGSHFVTAHGSPDLDTTIASFWGWADAFAARVAQGLHIWNVPGGPPPAPVEMDMLFYKMLSPSIFDHVAKHRTSLTVSSLDLMTQEGIVRKRSEESSLSIDFERGPSAVLLVDAEGFFLGDWRGIDAEEVRFIITLLNQCLRWYENHLHVRLISLFAKEDLTRSELEKLVRTVAEMKIADCEPAKEFTERQKKLVEKYLSTVFGMKRGIDSTMEEFAKSKFNFEGFLKELQSLEKSSVFDAKGKIQENRALLFQFLTKIIHGLDQAIYTTRQYVERLDVALQVKTSVLGKHSESIHFRADLEEIRGKIAHFPYLTVTSPDKEGKLFPLGVIFAPDLFKTTLGTVTLRDFCNRSETKIPPYLEVISVIDHHKSEFATSTPPVVYITDAQSSNALVAELAFAINDRFSTGGLTIAEIEKQMKDVQKDLSTPSSKRVFQRLLQRHLSGKQNHNYFVSPEREKIEYLHFLYGILDDTDLLTKVSVRDVECVASLLNRLYSLTEQKEMEVIDFDDIARDSKFAKAAAKKILQNEQMYPLYRRVYMAKEAAVDENLKACISGKPSSIFADTKEQNGCCRVGQTKFFPKNFPVFAKHATDLRKLWLAEAQKVYQNKKEIDFHLHMISTVEGADELYKGAAGKYAHKDEIWIWTPPSETGAGHLKNFLSAFGATAPVKTSEMQVEFLGDNSKELAEIFRESFEGIPQKVVNQKLPIAVLYFKAGHLNSRKAMVSPYLPQL
ncbi:MAG: hypothetical protein JSR58_00205 [Verrucomicrobia bacterium]|nr:hypothetical protein [Verrucomicrobiota bacterium]